MHFQPAFFTFIFGHYYARKEKEVENPWFRTLYQVYRVSRERLYNT
jgi:hypothetical protein